jgi:hypothetical protein
MEIKTHLNVFDFDETLFRVPNYTCKEATGMEPYEWFDNPTSLDSEFNIKPITNTILAAQRETAINCLITHRKSTCSQAVERLLKENGITMNLSYFLGRADSKAQKVKATLIDNPEIQTVTIYEDTIWEIMKYVKYFTEYPMSVKINFVFVDKSKVMVFNWTIASVIAMASQTAQRLIID